MRKTLAAFSILVLASTLVFAFTTTGPKLPTAATGNTNTIGGGTNAWVNPTNIELADGTNATVNLLTPALKSDDLIGTGFGFAITSTDTINGITLQIRYTDTGAGGTNSESNVRILKAGTATPTNHSTGAVIPLSPTTVSYGGTSDLWGATWAPSDTNATTFGAAFVCVTSTGSDQTGVDFFEITITSTPAPPPVSHFLQMFGFKFDPPKPHSQTRFITVLTNTRRETQP